MSIYQYVCDLHDSEWKYVCQRYKLAFGDSLNDRIVFGDRSYRDKDYFLEKEATNNLTMFTPLKNVKGKSDMIRMRDIATWSSSN